MKRRQKTINRINNSFISECIDICILIAAGIAFVINLHIASKYPSYDPTIMMIICVIIVFLLMIYETAKFCIRMYVRTHIKTFNIIKISNSKIKVDTCTKYKPTQNRKVYVIKNIRKIKEIGILTIVYGQVECRRCIGSNVNNRIKKEKVIFLRYLVNEKNLNM